jgi:tRNA nucleotidyltransferase/poly(A) polymerase
MRKTYEQLQKEIIEFNQSNQAYAIREERLKKEFSKVLGAPRTFNGYNQDTVYSWEQIFSEVGKLLAQQNILNILNSIQGLEYQVAELQKSPEKN